MNMTQKILLCQFSRDRTKITITWKEQKTLRRYYTKRLTHLKPYEVNCCKYYAPFILHTYLLASVRVVLSFPLSGLILTVSLSSSRPDSTISVVLSSLAASYSLPLSCSYV